MTESTCLKVLQRTCRDDLGDVHLALDPKNATQQNPSAQIWDSILLELDVTGKTCDTGMWQSFLWVTVVVMGYGLLNSLIVEKSTGHHMEQAWMQCQKRNI